MPRPDPWHGTVAERTIASYVTKLGEDNNQEYKVECGSVGKYAIDCADGRVCLNLMAKKSRFKGLLMPLKESYVEVGGNGAMAYRPTGGKRT